MLGRRDILRTLITLPSAAGQMFGEAPALRPYLQDVSAGEATLLWPPDGAAESSIEWTSGDRAWTHCSAALREALPQDEAGGWPPPQASARLTGLPPGSTVSYRVSDEPGIVHRFRTPRKEPAPFRFLAFGDSGAGTEEQFELARRMEAEGADFCVHTGDVVYPIPTPEGIRQRYLDCYRDLMASGPMYVCLGNHDYAAERGVPFLRVHSFPGVPGAPREDEGRYYSFEWNSARIIALDSNLLADGVPARESERMLRWLDGELERPAFWRIVFFHHPPYTLGKHADDPICAEVMRRLAPRLERAGVQLVLNGHDHNYQRFDPIRGTVYCVTGGGGGGLYPVTPHPRHAASAELYHFVRVDVSGWSGRVLRDPIGAGAQW